MHVIIEYLRANYHDRNTN